MKIFRFLFCLAVAFIFLNTVCFAGYDDSRKVITKPRGEGGGWSELRRPGDKHLDWEGVELHWQKDPSKKGKVEKEEYLTEYGAMEEGWHRDVLGEPVEGTYSKGIHDPETRWDDLKILDYQQDLSAPSGIENVSRQIEDEGWQMGSHDEWKEAEPGRDSMKTAAEQASDAWRSGIPNWTINTQPEESRPIQGVQYSYSIQDRIFSGEG